MDYSSEAFSGLRILGIWWMGPFTHREERKQDQRLGIKTCEVHHLPIFETIEYPYKQQV